MDPLPSLDAHPRVALVVDNPLRDLPGLCLVALELIERGCKVFLVPMYLNEESFSLAPDFVLLNYLRKVSHGVASNFVSNHIQFGVLDTEGGPTADIETKYISYLCDDAVINGHVSPVCAWGTEIAEVLKTNGIYSADQITITGNPRFDLYCAPWCEAISDSADDGSDDFADYVLICSNFALTNSQYGNREKIAENLRKYYSCSAEEVERLMAEETVAIRQLTAAVIELARTFPERHFVYRPHPFEAVAFYDPYFAELPNVSVIKRGAVTGWMINAAVVVQLNCTTCYDAWFAQTRSLKPAWIVQESGFGTSLSINHPCADQAALSAAIQAVYDGTFECDVESDERALGLVHRFFGHPDGNSHRRVADAIVSRIDTGMRKKRLQCLRRIRLPIGRADSKWWRPIADLASHLTRKAGFQLNWNLWNLKSRRAWVAKHDASEKSFDIPQVRKIVATLARARGVSAPRVESAWQAGEFAFGGRFSRAIAILPDVTATSEKQK